MTTQNLRNFVNGQQVEAAGGDHDVGNLGHVGDLFGHRLDVAFAPDADHCLPGKADLQRIGHRDDLHDATVEQALDALSDGGL